MPENHSLPHNNFSRRNFLYLTTTALATGTMATMVDFPAQRRAHAQAAAGHHWSLNPEWQFAGPLLDPSDAPQYTGRFEPVNLPHTVTKLSWREWDPADWEGYWLYRKKFDLPEGTGEYRYLLHFEGALTATYPWLNGERLPEYIGGYLPFEREITGRLKESGNQLDVVVDGRWEINTPPNRPEQPNTSVDLWQPAGLYRGVKLYAVPRNYLADVFARPRQVLDPDARSLDVQATVDVAAPGTEGELEVELRDGEVVVAERTVPVALDQAGRDSTVVSLTGLTGVDLWSTENPKLYQIVVRLRGGDQRPHEYRTNIGFRQAEFTKEGFFLNGERLQLIGSGRHHLYPFAGAAMPPRVQRKDAEILKQHGHNMVRCTVYPQDVSFLDACDELGLLVYDEAPGWGYLGDEEWLDRSLRDVREMILRDRNHPSIVLWGARLNETPDNEEFYTRTQKAARELDDSRQTTGAMIFHMYDTNNFQQDVFGYNDYARNPNTKYPRLREPRRDRPYLVTEAVGTLSGPAKFYRRTDPVAEQQAQAIGHALVHDQARADAGYCGVLGWASYDYQSENGNVHQGIKTPGIFDMFREPKPGAAIYTAQLDPATRAVIEPAFYWDFEGHYSVHHLEATAMICSNADRLELFVDGKEYDTLQPARENYPNLPYPPFFADFRSVDGASTPELRIDAYLGSRRIGSRLFSANHDNDRLHARPDDAELVADGSDATRVVCRVVDEHGAPRPGRAGQLRFTLDGPAILLGDNPFPLGETGGVGAVWLRGHHQRTGEAVLRVEHDTLGSQTVRVRLKGLEDER